MAATPGLVLCHGCWDLLHPGHIEHLRQAKAMGDRLIVSVTSDQYVSKGPGRPVFNAELRKTMLEALRFVDEVVICDHPTAVPAIERYQPAIYVKGPDYVNGQDSASHLAKEKELVERYGGRLEFTTGEKFSSTSLINQSMHSLPEARGYLERLRIQHSAADVLEWLGCCRPLSVRVIGEVITDQYVYVHPAGKSAKESTITYIGVGTDCWPGGVAVIEGHLLEVVRRVDICKPDSHILKIRYVEKPFLHKVFSYVPQVQVEAPLDPKVLKEEPDYDIVLVADFGHGLIPDYGVALAICQIAPFLALTVQANSLNWGFNLITKYPKADYVVVDEMELRLACQDRETDIRELAQFHARRMGCQQFAVTRGHEGALVWQEGEFEEAPALAPKVVDRMGAGDAFLAWSAPLVKVGAPKEVVAFVGSVAAAIKVGQLGNQTVKTETVKQWIRGLLA